MTLRRSLPRVVVGSLLVLLGAALPLVAKQEQLRPLTPAVEQAIQSMFPGAKIDEVQTERFIVTLNEVTVIADGREYDLVISDAGTVLTATELIANDALPASALAGVRTVDGKGKIVEAEKIRVLAELKPVPLAKPKLAYSAKFVDKDREREVFVTEDGRVIRTVSKAAEED
jgi:hypothetical protein